MVKVLIECGADVDAKDSSGQTVLMREVEKGHTEMVKVLIECGADVDAKDSSGQTVLMREAKKGHNDMVKVLLDAGAKLNEKDKNGQSAIMREVEILKPPISTLVPGIEPIELVAYYDEFLWYYPNCEMATKGWFVQNIEKDWVIIDCGASIGYYSILFALLASQGQVYAFEPTITYDMLLKNLNHHKLTSVTTLRMAVGKLSGLVEDSIYRIWGKDPEKKLYNFITIDDFMEKHDLSRLDCIKIDVDSFDFEVLQGAEKTLTKYDPFVMVELNDALSKRNQSVTQALEWLTNLGYKESVVYDYDNFLFKRGIQLTGKKEDLPRIKISFDQTTQVKMGQA